VSRALLIATLLVCAAAPAHADSGLASATALRATESGSISCGSTNRGSLSAPARLDPEGDAWFKPAAWEKRGLHFGTDELVGVIQRAARKVAAQYPGSTLGVADLSKVAGGAAVGHASHQSGRDADILFYAIDKAGNYVFPDSAMPMYEANGRATSAEAPVNKPKIRQRWFDLRRNWALVRALIEDRNANVVAIFVAGGIEKWLLDYARAIGESPRVIERAQFILVSPKGTRAHRDHMHIRVACAPDDVAAGRCSDDNAPRLGRGRRYTAAVTCP
jgi:penicillin-insensitive murein DD-endopeptidase